MTTTEKTRETRLRRMADRQGLRLLKSRTRDPRAIDYGAYMLVDIAIGGAVFGTGALGRADATLDDIEEYLTQPGGEAI